MGTSDGQFAKLVLCWTNDLQRSTLTICGSLPYFATPMQVSSVVQVRDAAVVSSAPPRVGFAVSRLVDGTARRLSNRTGRTAKERLPITIVVKFPPTIVTVPTP